MGTMLLFPPLQLQQLQLQLQQQHQLRSLSSRPLLWRGTAPGSCSTARPSTLGSTTTRTTPGCSLHQHQQQQQPGGGNSSPTVSYSSRSRLKCDRCCSCSFHIYIKVPKKYTFKGLSNKK